MLWALVMAGGHGTRLWPVSTPKKPKPFLNLIPGKRTLLEETLLRLKPIVPESRVFLIGSAEHLSLLKKFGGKVPKKQIIGEPVKRNTAAPVVLAASLIAQKDPEGVLVVLPADHWIGKPSSFRKSIKNAAGISNRDRRFSILGVNASFPSPAYGYLKSGKKVAGDIYQLEQFVEKPTVEKAKKFLETYRYFWHAGIFLAPVGVILDSAKRLSPKLFRGIQKLKVQNGKINASFSKLPDISFDYAILERLKNAYMVHSDCDWTDAGSWESLAELWAKNKHFNNQFVKRLVR